MVIKLHKCKHCERTFDRQQDLTNHIRQAHSAILLESILSDRLEKDRLQRFAKKITKHPTSFNIPFEYIGVFR